MAADAAAVGIALADAVACADMDGVGAAVGDVLGADVAGAEVSGAEVTGPDAARPEWAPGVWCTEAARAIPPAADAASSPATIEAMVSGRASRRRWRRPRAARDGQKRAGRSATAWRT